MKPMAYLVTRLAIGATLFFHGLVRLPKLTSFVQGTVGSFENSMLPTALVEPFGYVIVFGELITGLLLLIGWYTRIAATAAGMLMVLLIVGTCLIENWGALPSQLIHTAFLIVVIQFEASNTVAVDRVLQKDRKSTRLNSSHVKISY